MSDHDPFFEGDEIFDEGYPEPWEEEPHHIGRKLFDWTDASRNVHPLVKMSDGYIRNVVAYLKRKPGDTSHIEDFLERELQFRVKHPKHSVKV